MSWDAWVARERRTIMGAGRWRALRDLDAASVCRTLPGLCTPVVSFASNDYLGLSRHPDVIAAAHEATKRWGCGAGSARLLADSCPVHEALERELASWKGAERALLFPTGYAANLGAITAFAGPGVRICSDELNHASIIDGCRLGRAQVSVYPHLQIGELKRALDGAGRAIVVTESVFSMDGDVAPIAEIADLCRRHQALLILDEAHGVLDGEPDLKDVAALRVGTLSKTMGSLGGFVAGPGQFIELLVNRARTFIFTTAPPPSVAAAALAALRVLRSSEGERLRCRLRSLIDCVRPGHPSPIIPIMMGDERRALDVAERLLERGLLVPAIRPPTVPPGTSRLRVSLTAAHTEEHVDRLLGALTALQVVP
jgi:8-amino-7-oxononanoate synthase